MCGIMDTIIKLGFRMGLNSIKIDKADKVFSQYIRLRDRKCVRCGSLVKLNLKGLPISHQASHYFGRGIENTRFDPENVDCLCTGCHQIWGSENKETYRDFKIKQLGENKFNMLKVRSNTYKKKDRKASYIIVREFLKQIQK